MPQIKKIVFLSISLFFSLSIFNHAQAAKISFETPQTTASVGDTIVLRVRLNTEGASINAVDLGILYPAILSVKNISKSGSFIQIWVKEPSYTKDAIFLSGGLPGGIVSNNAVVVTITFEAKAVGDGALGLSPASSVLLNDGSGTSVPISLQTPTIHVVPRKATQTPQTVSNGNKDVSVKQANSDFIKPNRFNIEIGSDARLFSGKYFVSFFATDSGSGVDHYQLKEGDGPYVSARSPYLLSDQTLRSVIYVRAYDGGNNYREEIYPGIWKRIWWGILRIFHR